MRLLVMQTIQQRRERENRQINERLRTLIAAYKTLGGSFTGNLAVDPAHLRDRAVSRRAATQAAPDETAVTALRRRSAATRPARSDGAGFATRSRRRSPTSSCSAPKSRCGLQRRRPTALAEGRTVETAELVVSLRNFIREVLDLDPMPADLAIPKQGPLRPVAGASRGAGRSEASTGGAGAARGVGGDRTGGGTGAGALAGSTVYADDEAHQRLLASRITRA